MTLEVMPAIWKTEATLFSQICLAVPWPPKGLMKTRRRVGRLVAGLRREVREVNHQLMTSVSEWLSST